MPSTLTDAPSALLARDPLPSPEPAALAVVCAWCGRPLGRGANSSARRVSHGICRPCSDELLYSDAAAQLPRR
jgi:hypothetical protein